ncbi:MAG: archaellin/type IV pilin N-terminal domain-containing protein [bacterium]|nr:archaellin/type IV pilin N-terminal domain-containing protein [bacterium]
MFNNFNKEQRGQTALETAIILIAFVVVASVFAFTILSAGTASTERGEQAIAAGLEGVQSSMQVKGSILAEGATNEVTNVRFSLQLVAGGEPVNMNDANRVVVIDYRDNTQILTGLNWTATWIVDVDGAAGTADADDLLEEGELVEITVPLAAANLGPNTEFTLEVKPPTGAVLTFARTTPPAIEAVNEF